MKKRIVSWLMTLVMVLGLIPTQVWADVTYDTTEDTTPQVSAFSLDEGVTPLALTASAPERTACSGTLPTAVPTRRLPRWRPCSLTLPPTVPPALWRIQSTTA